MNMQTIDLDHYKIFNKSSIEDIIKRIMKCKHIHKLYIRESALNGHHLKIFCKSEDSCELCRLCFDDQTRFSADYLNREPWEKNVLFTYKTYIKAGKTIKLKAGKWKEVKVWMKQQFA
jgi:predicted DNA binding protein